jgi:hypothetical protein
MYLAPPAQTVLHIRAIQLMIISLVTYDSRSFLQHIFFLDRTIPGVDDFNRFILNSFVKLRNVQRDSDREPSFVEKSNTDLTNNLETICSKNNGFLVFFFTIFFGRVKNRRAKLIRFLLCQKNGKNKQSSLLFWMVVNNCYIS